MQRQTFIDHMKKRGYSISTTINGNIPDHPALKAYMRVQVPQGHEKKAIYLRSGNNG